jgi:hypothetical protein
MRAAVPPITAPAGKASINTYPTPSQREALLLFFQLAILTVVRAEPKLPSLLHCCSFNLQVILDSNHQSLREKAAKLDWRVDPLIPKVKRAFGSRLAGGSRVCYSWSLLLAG